MSSECVRFALVGRSSLAHGVTLQGPVDVVRIVLRFVIFSRYRNVLAVVYIFPPLLTCCIFYSLLYTIVPSRIFWVSSRTWTR